MNVKSYEDTLAFLSSYVRPAAETEIRKLSDALGFVLAENLISNLDLPRFNNAAMDGWAFGSENIQPESFTLTCVGSAFAGYPYEGKLRPGECIRIMTGAEVPEGADTVVKQEIVTSELLSPRACAKMKTYASAAKKFSKALSVLKPALSFALHI